jgi:hypothetical protein
MQSTVGVVTLLLPIPVSFLVLGPFKEPRAWALASLLGLQLLRLVVLGTSTILLQCLSLVLGCSLLEGASAAEAAAGVLKQLGFTGIATRLHPSSAATDSQQQQQHRYLEGLDYEDDELLWVKGRDGYSQGSPLTPRSNGSPGRLHRGPVGQQKGGLVSQMLQNQWVKPVVQIYTCIEQQPVVLRCVLGAAGAAVLTSLVKYGKVGEMNRAAPAGPGVWALKPEPQALEQWIGALLPIVWGIGCLVMAGSAVLWLLQLVERVRWQGGSMAKPLIEAEQVLHDGEGLAGACDSPGAGLSTPTASISFGGARASASAAGTGVGGSLWGLGEGDVRIVTPKVKPPRRGEYTLVEEELGDGLVEVDQPSRTGGKGKAAGRGRGGSRSQGSKTAAARKAAAAAKAAADEARAAATSAVAIADAADVPLPEDDQADGDVPRTGGARPVRTGSLQAAVAAAAAGASGAMAGLGKGKGKHRGNGWGTVLLGTVMCFMVLGSYFAGGLGLYTQEGVVKQVARCGREGTCLARECKAHSSGLLVLLSYGWWSVLLW